MTLTTTGSTLTMRASIDANAAIDYAREYALHHFGMEPTGRKGDVLRKRLSQVGRVFIAETAVEEAQRNLLKDLVQKLGHETANKIKNTATEMLNKYCKDHECEDNLEYIPAAQQMYALISNNPANQKFSTWKKKKSRFVDDPILGSDINDLKILSTAVYYARICAAEFWTHDMDFTMFADEILRMFGLVVVDTYSLGDRFL